MRLQRARARKGLRHGERNHVCHTQPIGDEILTTHELIQMKLDAKDAAIIAKKYFEETKTHHYFLFETVKTSYNDKKEHWVVDCEVKNIFEAESREYLVWVRDDGTISDVEIKDPAPL